MRPLTSCSAPAAHFFGTVLNRAQIERHSFYFAPYSSSGYPTSLKRLPAMRAASHLHVARRRRMISSAPITDAAAVAPVPMSGPDITDIEIRSVAAVLHSGCLSIGPQLEEFERQVPAVTGAKHAIGVSSGTAGLHLAVIVAGVEAGDLVITTPFSFVASANCVLYERGIPVFVDVDPATGNIDPALVAQAASDLRAGGAARRRWLPPAVATTTRAPER